MTRRRKTTINSLKYSIIEKITKKEISFVSFSITLIQSLTTHNEMVQGPCAHLRFKCWDMGIVATLGTSDINYFSVSTAGTVGGKYPLSSIDGADCN
jgi:hypothetical protein